MLRKSFSFAPSVSIAVMRLSLPRIFSSVQKSSNSTAGGDWSESVAQFAFHFFNTGAIDRLRELAINRDALLRFAHVIERNVSRRAVRRLVVLFLDRDCLFEIAVSHRFARNENHIFFTFLLGLRRLNQPAFLAGIKRQKIKPKLHFAAPRNLLALE